MRFTLQQIEEVLEIIDFQHIFFTAHNISTRAFSSRETNLLKKHGVDLSKISTQFTPFQEAFYFGRLASALGKQVKGVTYSNFKKYLRQGQYIPLTPVERNTLGYLEGKAFSHIKGLSERAQLKAEGILSTVNSRTQYEEIIKEAVKGTVGKENSAVSVMSEIGNATQDWKRDLGRIAETELQNSFQHGVFMDYVEKYGDNVLLYKEVFPGACKYCIKLYLTNGIGSRPILFTPKELMENGDNIGIRPENWKATIGTVHPFCRCNLLSVGKNEKWDEEKKDFVYDREKVLEGSRKIKGKIKVTVGDQVFEV